MTLTAESSPAGEGTGAKTYLLKSLLPLDLRQRFVEPPKTASLKGFGAVILCLIHLAQDSLSEGERPQCDVFGIAYEETF